MTPAPPAPARPCNRRPVPDVRLAASAGGAGELTHAPQPEEEEGTGDGADDDACDGAAGDGAGTRGAGGEGVGVGVDGGLQGSQ